MKRPLLSSLIALLAAPAGVFAADVVVTSNITANACVYNTITDITCKVATSTATAIRASPRRTIRLVSRTTSATSK